MPRYRIIVVTPAPDYATLDRGAGVLGDQRVALVALEDTPRPPSNEFYGSRTVLSMEIEDVTTQAARAQALGIYEGIRERAGLPPGTGHEPIAL